MRRPSSGCNGTGAVLRGARFPLLFLELVEFRHFQSQVGGLSVLDSCRASQQDVREESVVLAVLGLAVGEAGETAKAPPVRRAGVRVVPFGKGLGNECGERCRVHIIVLEPGLEVAEAGFNHGARLKTVAGEPGDGIRCKVVENGKAVFSRWPDVDVRAARIVSLEERKTGADGLRGQIG